MAANLIDTARSLITPDVISKISSTIGETPAKTQQALGVVVPSLAGIACNEASTPSGASKLFNLINNTKLPADLHSNLAGLLAGGGVRGGQVVGSSDRVGGYPKERPVHISDLAATVYHALGADPRSLVRDIQGQPHAVCDGQSVLELF